MSRETLAFKLKVQNFLDEIRRTGKVYLPTSRAKRRANQKWKQEMNVIRDDEDIMGAFDKNGDVL